MKNDLLKSILDNEFLETLAKSADLYKIGTNSVLDPQEILIGLKVVPRAVMSMLISELAPMEVNSHKDIHLPFGKQAFIRINKNAADDFTGSIYSDNKIVYSFMNRSIPGLGIILLSTFELYDVEQLSGQKLGQSGQNVPIKENEDIDRKVQKLIDERMELHSLVNRVVEDKIAQREAIHKIMMSKLGEALKATPIPPAPVTAPIPHIEPKIASIEIKQADMVKKEVIKKGSPLKAFLDRKKKPAEHSVKIEKSETIDCSDCGQVIFGEVSGFSGCICYGPDQHRKIWMKKSEDGVQLRFSRGWDPENIECLLETLRKNNGRH